MDVDPQPSSSQPNPSPSSPSKNPNASDPQSKSSSKPDPTDPTETLLKDDSSQSIALYDMFDISTVTKFKNKDYILKFSNQSNIKFFKDELTIKYSGKGYNLIDYATVQCNNPLSKKDPIFYFEVEIIDEGSKKDITIGFSDKEVILNKQCGTISKSYGYNGDGKKYWDDNKENFGPKFKKNDVIGCGFYFSKNSIFYTYNGKFLDYAFTNVEKTTYFATISLHSLNECVKANFGKSNYAFDIEGFYISESKKKINKLLEIETSVKDLDYIIREYLVHSGYQETFNELEMNSMNINQQNKDKNIDKNIDKNNEKSNEINTNNNNIKQIDENNDELSLKNQSKMQIDEEEVQKIRRYSVEEAPELKKKELSLILDSTENKDNKEKDILKLMDFLEERKIIRNMLSSKDYDTAIEYFTKHFGEYKTDKETNYKKIIISLNCMKYLDSLRNNDYMKGFEILNALDKTFWNDKLYICLYDLNDNIIEVNLEKLSMLICYQNINETEFAFYLSQRQIDFLGYQVNSLILEMTGLSNESVLEKIMKQQKLIDYTYNLYKNSPGEKLTVKIS